MGTEKLWEGGGRSCPGEGGGGGGGQVGVRVDVNGEVKIL